MKNPKYRSLKFKIMLQTIGLTLIAALIGYSIYFILIDGIFQEPFANLMVGLFQKLSMDEESAILVYRTIFWKNKTLILTCGFIVLYLFSFYLGMSRFTDYLDEISNGIHMIIKESTNMIELSDELQPLESQMNTIKNTLRNREYQALQSEQRKNDLVVYLLGNVEVERSVNINGFYAGSDDEKRFVAYDVPVLDERLTLHEGKTEIKCLYVREILAVRSIFLVIVQRLSVQPQEFLHIGNGGHAVAALLHFLLIQGLALHHRLH